MMIAVDSIKLDAVAEIGRNPVCDRFSLSLENEQAVLGRDGRICLARSNSQARTGTTSSGKY